MTIIELIQADGFFTKRAGSTHGGEYAGPCPWCGGQDRFRAWPEQGEAGKYWCRQCGRNGDAIQYLRDYRRMTYQEACAYLGREPRPRTGEPPAARPAWEPRTCTSPGELWQRQARRLVNESVYHLWSPPGRAVVDYLSKEKGLESETIRAFSLGWLPGDRWAARPAWGLPEILKENRKPKKLWLPKGITIPLLGTNVPKPETSLNHSEFQKNQVERVRIRRPEGEPRYYLVSGSNTGAMVIGEALGVAVVVESELDAMLLQQEAGELVNLVALGNAQARPDREAAELLKRAPLILVGLDADQAGAKEAWQWWRAHYPQAHRWPPIQGKDPGEMYQAGVNLRAWVQAGLAEYGE